MRTRVAPQALVAALLAALSVARSATAQLPPFLEVRVPKAPTVATGNGASFLVYELHVTNFMTQPVTLKRIEIVDDAAHRVLQTLADSVIGTTFV